MDWNKIKTIFIIVFFILNIFLFLLFFNRYNEAQEYQVDGETTIQERLQADNIRFNSTPVDTIKESYASGNIQVYSFEDLPESENQTYEVFNSTELLASFNEPIGLGTLVNPTVVNLFVNEHVFNGASYELFKIDETSMEATYFQTINNRQIFHNQNALLTIYWNEENEVYKYEQTALEDLEAFEQTENLLTDDTAVEVLYQRNLIKPNSTISLISLGYSTLVQLTETQVFAPTWRVRVELQDGTNEDYFVNAVEGKIIEFSKDPEEIVEQ
ncbi:two-component system regulatory protein YycI [Paenisporosarcina sp. TG20]|uniref:two-component system regulatory protein YycI n=1 Tax=Paenisporosarcina sp. TG20 TaxID=1211706 RepID=UPI000314D24A|nr:two-component system regulatory protein YycI [Paenisporosarcina sp. TG20]